MPLSIVVPVKNEAKRIEPLLRGILAQTYRPLEVIFVDGGSTDGTLEILEKFSKEAKKAGIRVKILAEEGPIKSPANARNVGVANSSYDYVAFFDVDFDLSTDAKVVEKVVEGLRRNLHVAITYMPNMHTWVEKNLAKDDIMHFNGKPLHLVCGFRKEVFRYVIFDVNLGFHEDVDFLTQLKAKLEVNPMIVDSNVRRCYVHSVREYLKRMLWYGRTAHRYYRKAMPRKWLVHLIRSNTALGFLALFATFLPINPMIALLPLIALLSLIYLRWLRKDFKLGYGLFDRFLWYFFRETIGRFIFDIGLLYGLLSRHTMLGRE